jgi:hypothetical protein
MNRSLVVTVATVIALSVVQSASGQAGVGVLKVAGSAADEVLVFVGKVATSSPKQPSPLRKLPPISIDDWLPPSMKLEGGSRRSEALNSALDVACVVVEVHEGLSQSEFEKLYQSEVLPKLHMTLTESETVLLARMVVSGWCKVKEFGL